MFISSDYKIKIIDNLLLTISNYNLINKNDKIQLFNNIKKLINTLLDKSEETIINFLKILVKNNPTDTLILKYSCKEFNIYDFYETQCQTKYCIKLFDNIINNKYYTYIDNLHNNSICNLKQLENCSILDFIFSLIHKLLKFLNYEGDIYIQDVSMFSIFSGESLIKLIIQ